MNKAKTLFEKIARGNPAVNKPTAKSSGGGTQSFGSAFKSARSSGKKVFTWKGKKYPRKYGKIFYDFKWYNEGDGNLPWEAEAIRAEKQ